MVQKEACIVYTQTSLHWWRLLCDVGQSNTLVAKSLLWKSALGLGGMGGPCKDTIVIAYGVEKKSNIVFMKHGPRLVLCVNTLYS